MQALHFLFSPAGRLSPRSFAIAAGVLYLAGITSQALTRPELVARGGLWLFAVAQALLVWIWFALHARRLRDGGAGIGPALAASLLYAISVALLLLVVAGFYGTLAPHQVDASASAVLGLMLLLAVVGTLSGAPQHDLATALVAILLALAIVPIAVMVGVTLWAATRRRLDSGGKP